MNKYQEIIAYIVLFVVVLITLILLIATNSLALLPPVILGTFFLGFHFKHIISLLK